MHKEIVSDEKFTKDLLCCIVLEKESPRIEIATDGSKIIKDGFHFHFPKFIWLCKFTRLLFT